MRNIVNTRISFGRISWQNPESYTIQYGALQFDKKKYILQHYVRSRDKLNLARIPVARRGEHASYVTTS